MAGTARTDPLAHTFNPALSFGLAGGCVWFIHQALFALGLHPWPLWVEVGFGGAIAYILSTTIAAGLRRLSWRDREPEEDDAPAAAIIALWCAPAAILAAHSSPVWLVAAWVAIVSATRLFALRWGQTILREPPKVPAIREGNLFAFESPLSRVAIPALPVATAMAAETALFAALIGHTYVGLSLAGIVTALSVLIVSREAQRRPRRPAVPARRAATSILLAVVLALVAQGLPFQKKHKNPLPRPGSAEEYAVVGRAYRPVEADRPAGAREAREPPLSVGGGQGGYPGVILWPEVRPVVLLVPPAPSGTGRLKYSRNPLGIPFGGEYWMYRDPNRRPPPRSYFRRGSPLLGVFQTTDRQPLRMEARHKLEQRINIACCSAIQLVILNSDPDSAEISIELSLLGRRQKLGAELNLGASSVSSRPAPKRTPARETLAYRVPRVQYQFDEFRVVFQRNAARVDKSAVMAIDRFVLVPR